MQATEGIDPAAAAADRHGAASAPTILAPGRNVWRVARAERAAVLQDGAAYFGALRRAMLKARRSILVLGWDIDSRTPLVGARSRPEDGLPATLAAFLGALVGRRPDLSIRLLLWDYSMLYALERELLPALTLRWNTPPQVELCLDDTVPFGASHHQKVVVVDDALAFSGGLDLTIRRWDMSEHRPRDKRRRDPYGKPYRPFHDVQMMVDGPAAAALGELARERWARAACETLPDAAPPEADPWPEEIVPDLRDVRVGIARTRPAFRGSPEVREVEALCHDMIDAAERSIYIESQFLTDGTFARRLVRRLRERPALEAVIIAPQTHHTWLEHRTMLAGRIRFMQAVREAGLEHRVRLLYPHVRRRGAASEVMVHSKVIVVDDRLLRVGSANLCNRSMGTDTECDLVVEAASDADRAAIARVRDRLIGEHCGAAPAAVAARIARGGGSLSAAIDALEGGARQLRPIEDGRLGAGEPIAAIEAAADPRRPIDAAEFLADFSGDGPPPRSLLPALLRAALVLVPVALLMLAWRYTPLAGLLKPEAFQTAVQAGGSWGPAVALALFLLLGFLAFPVNVLIIGTAAVFGIWPGLAYAAVGALASAAVTYAVGRRIGSAPLRSLFGPRINRIIGKANRRGVMAVTMVRLLPVAPFTLVNLVAGAMRIRFLDYMIGTALGLLPGVLLMSVLGDRLFRILERPTLANVLALLGVLLAWAGLTWLVQRLVSRARREA
jgi:phospholipase D1/2